MNMITLFHINKFEFSQGFWGTRNATVNNEILDDYPIIWALPSRIIRVTLYANTKSTNIYMGFITFVIEVRNIGA